MYSEINMNNKYSAYVLFYGLGLVFWAINLNFTEATLLCVFYSIFVGTVWGLIPRVSGAEPLSWKYLLPPFLLVMLMMFSVSLKMVLSTDVIFITSMSLIHFRSSVLSFARIPKRASSFYWIQLFSFIFGLTFIFQKNFLPIQLTRKIFLMSMMGMSVISIGILLAVKNDQTNRDN